MKRRELTFGFTKVHTDPALGWRERDLRYYTGNGGDGAMCFV